MTPAAFRECLAQLRWSQRTLAKLLGVSYTVVHRWGRKETHVIPTDVATWLDKLAAFIRAHPPPRERA